jgi:glycosyltransferase involved in cell wall biosynthesis
MVMVSVVVPFLNAGRYLPEAIASVQTQTCHDWEMVLIDDGSTDDSAGIVARAASADPRIHLLRRPPRQLAPQRHVISAFWRPAESSWASSTPMTFTSPTTCNPGYRRSSPPRSHDGLWTYPLVAPGSGAPRLDRRNAPGGGASRTPDLLNRVVLMQLGHVPCTCGVIIRRYALALTGGFDEAFHLYEDQTRGSSSCCASPPT